MIIEKYLDKKQNKHLTEYLNSQTDGIILYAKPERARNLSEERYRIQECENSRSSNHLPESLCQLEI